MPLFQVDIYSYSCDPNLITTLFTLGLNYIVNQINSAPLNFTSNLITAN